MLARMTRQYSKRGGTYAEGTISAMNHGYLSEMIPRSISAGGTFLSKQTYLEMFIINQCDLRRPQGASGCHKVFASRALQASEARLYILIYVMDQSVNWPKICESWLNLGKRNFGSAKHLAEPNC